MGRPGQLHDDDCSSGGQRGCEPAQRLETRLIRHQTEEFGDADADQGAEEVAEDQGARLGEGAVNGAEDEDGRGALLILLVFRGLRLWGGKQGMMPQALM